MHLTESANACQTLANVTIKNMSSRGVLCCWMPFIKRLHVQRWPPRVYSEEEPGEGATSLFIKRVRLPSFNLFYGWSERENLKAIVFAFKLNWITFAISSAWSYNKTFNVTKIVTSKYIQKWKWQTPSMSNETSWSLSAPQMERLSEWGFDSG